MEATRGIGYAPVITMMMLMMMMMIVGVKRTRNFILSNK